MKIGNYVKWLNYYGQPHPYYSVNMDEFYYNAEIEYITEIIKNKLYFASTHGDETKVLKASAGTLYFTTDEELIYVNYYYDFGPLNLSCLYKFCCQLNTYLCNPSVRRIVYYSSGISPKRIHQILTIAGGSFRKIFNEKNLSLFTPKKDRCDLCIEYEKRNLHEDKWKEHVEDKNRSRDERSKDKDRASKGECILLCMDLQAVKVAPTLNAAKIYFKTNLGCHNVTVYNITSRQATCFCFSEVDTGLSASTFASCAVDYLERHCLFKKLPIVHFV
ncbi:Dual specificity protein phosphatase, N-terminal half [Popillia japonica]|uniref:Dual specificity protein phosphatase, N-terminal half n=1 Tax=Popillia japonica TaxID=7064 RepID=A0AAW1JFZ7_POPJA